MLQQIFNKRHSRLLLLLISGIIWFSCNKIDTQPAKNNPTNFEDKFFAITTVLNPKVVDVIEKLKAQNGMTNFVSKLPANCGIPVWDKLLFQTKQSNNVINNEDSLEIIVIPLSINNLNLSSLVIAKEQEDGSFLVECKTTNGYLYEKTHGQNIDLEKGTEALTLFFYMENRT